MSIRSKPYFLVAVIAVLLTAAACNGVYVDSDMANLGGNTPGGATPGYGGYVDPDKAIPSGNTPGTGGALSGTYYYNSGDTYYITFSTNGTCIFYGRYDQEAGTYTVSGNTVRTTFRGYSTFTIVNSTTIRDVEGYLWRKR